jgi:hypothetical protein
MTPKFFYLGHAPLLLLLRLHLPPLQLPLLLLLPFLRQLVVVIRLRLLACYLLCNKYGT